MPLEQVEFGAQTAPRCANSRGHGNGSEVPMRHQPTPGLCECGCGEPSPLAKQTRSHLGHVKGQPIRFINGHQRSFLPHPRAEGPDYIVEDRGYTTPCWIWQRSTDSDGYGHAWIPGSPGNSMPAHRRYYIEQCGPIPEGLVIDHLCRVTSCVNPDHLEPVTNTENLRRGLATRLTWDDISAIRTSAESAREVAERYGITRGHVHSIRNYKCWRTENDPRPSPVEPKTRCVNGHDYNEANTHFRANGARDCRACMRERSKAAYWRKKAEAEQAEREAWLERIAPESRERRCNHFRGQRDCGWCREDAA